MIELFHGKTDQLSPVPDHCKKGKYGDYERVNYEPRENSVAPVVPWEKN
jgi:hypothetical protein